MPLTAEIPFPRFDPVIFRVGPLALHWYAVGYILGFIAAYVLLRRMAAKGRLRFSAELVGDLLFWLVLGVILGGRLGWWVFYHRGPLRTWYEPLATWEGGMSFHGGLLGVLIVMILWSRYRKVSLGNMLDCAALVTPIGLFFGRIGNFINGELWGRGPTSVPWAMIFPRDPLRLPRHPSQLYEAALEGLVLLGIVWAFDLWQRRRGRRPADGRTAMIFLIAYGLLRFAVEFTREPDSQLGYLAFGWLTMGQVLSLAIVVAGTVAWKATGKRDQGPVAKPKK